MADVNVINPNYTTPKSKYDRLKNQTIPASSRYEEFIVSLTAPDGDLAVATDVEHFELNFDFIPLDVKLRCETAPTGANVEVDVNADGTSILSTVVSIDATETSSLTATTPPVVNQTTLSKGTVISFDVDQVGSTIAGAGCKVHLIGERV